MAILRCVCRIVIAGRTADEYACSKPQLLMPVIQYVMPSKNKALKKLLHFYWEICPKYDDNGKLKQEMILVVYVVHHLHARIRSRLVTAMPSGTTS